jgi:AbrB family looped-hinge helix DNA binding protein
MPTGTVSRKGQVVIPQAYRIEMGIAEGDKVSFRMEKGAVVMTSVKEAIRRACGSMKGWGLLEVLKEEKKKERLL